MFNFINKALHVLFDPAEFITNKQIQSNNWVAKHFNKSATYISQKIEETGEAELNRRIIEINQSSSQYLPHFLPAKKTGFSSIPTEMLDYIYDSTYQYKESVTNFLWDNKETLAIITTGTAVVAFGYIAYKYWNRSGNQKNQEKIYNKNTTLLSNQSISSSLLSQSDLEKILISINPTLSNSFIQTLTTISLEDIQGYKGIEESLNKFGTSNKKNALQEIKIAFAQEVATNPLVRARYEKSQYFLKAGLVNFIKERAVPCARFKS